MPKRLIDGEGVWRSGKINDVQPVQFRAEYANLLPLALADGTFEADITRVWSDVYSYNRPEISAADVDAILDEFERVGLLQRCADKNGKVWGRWVGIENRLPPKSQRHRYKKGNSQLFPQYRDRGGRYA